MSLMPFQILGMWLRPLLSIALLSLGIYLLVSGLEDRSPPVMVVETTDQDRQLAENPHPVGKPEDNQPKGQRTVNRFTFDTATASLVAGALLIFWTLGGNWVTSALFRPHDPNPPVESPGGTIQRLSRPDGTELHVESFGPPDGIPVILTHGWGLDSREWVYARKELASRCRIITWDLPGLGRSKGPANNDWSLEKLAGDLDAVVSLAGDRPVILAGHSIGGMIILTYWRLKGVELSHRLQGLIIGQSTFTNPVETTSMAWFYRLIQKPILEPLCYLMVALAPLVWLLNWWSYLTGSIHRTNHKSFFSGGESREQLGFISRYCVTSSPAVIARGFLAMFRYDATEMLGTISVPTLVVGGDKDVTCLPEASHFMSEKIRDASLLTLKSARHGGVFEFHKQFAEAIHRMISTVIENDQITPER